jgi:hypothetical protein
VRWFSAEEAASAGAVPTKYKPYSAKVSVTAMTEEEQAELIDDLETARSDNGARYNLRPRRKVVVYTA